MIKVLASVAVVFPQPVEACTRAPVVLGEPCETLNIHTPAPAFPAPLLSALRISNEYISKYGGVTLGSREDVLDLPEPFVVERLTEQGWQPVQYTLVDDENLFPGTRRIDLAEREPGSYRVFWPLSTCGEPKIDGGGALIGEFEVTPEVPYPAEVLGTIDVGFAFEEVTVHLGEGGNCQPIEANATIGRTTITLEFSDDWLPWADAASIALYVDGQLKHGFADVPTNAVLSKSYARIVDTVCASDHPSYSGGLSEGTYSIQLVARVDDQDEVFSESAKVTIDCQGDDVRR